MEQKTRAQWIAQLLSWQKNIEASDTVDPKFKTIAEECLDRVLEGMPSGSGFDNGCVLITTPESFAGNRFEFQVNYHHMKDGYYTGWTEHVVKVSPDWEGVQMKITGRDRNDIKTYIHEMMNDIMGEMLTKDFVYNTQPVVS